MGLYLYCIGASDHPDTALPPGVDGHAVRTATAAGLRVWVSDMATSPSASLGRVRAHNAVIEAVAATATPLPVRFGQWFDSADTLAASLESRADALRTGLERVRDAVEFGVRLRDPDAHAGRPPEPPDRSSGRAYLEALARRRGEEEASSRRLAEAAATLRSELGPLVRDQRVRRGDAAELAIAHLVDRHDTRAYAERLREFEARSADIRLVTSGPWPPYGFVDERP